VPLTRGQRVNAIPLISAIGVVTNTVVGA